MKENLKGDYEILGWQVWITVWGIFVFYFKGLTFKTFSLQSLKAVEQYHWHIRKIACFHFHTPVSSTAPGRYRPSVSMSELTLAAAAITLHCTERKGVLWASRVNHNQEESCVSGQKSLSSSDPEPGEVLWAFYSKFLPGLFPVDCEQSEGRVHVFPGCGLHT